jgi:glucokinase
MTDAAPGDWVVAVDIGGTKLAAALVDGAGRLIERRQVPTAAPGGDPSSGPPGTPADALFTRLTGLIESVVDAGAARGAGLPVAVGVGSGGPMALAGETVSPLNIPAWRDFPLRSRLAAATGLPVHIDNDAKALALGEGWRGAAVGQRHYLAMVVSTGVGAGIVLDGRLLDGRLGNAGHIGHVVVEPDGARCECGGQGCLEAEASGPSIAKLSGRPAAEATPEWIERTGTFVGRAVASVGVLLDLPLALVAGSVALGFGPPFFAAATAEIGRRARLPYASGLAIRPAGLGDAGPLMGAAAVGWRGIGLDPLGPP